MIRDSAVSLESSGFHTLPLRVGWRTHRDLNTGYKLRKLM